MRPPTHHDVKCAPSHFRGLIDGSKTCELRLNDRDYRVGDFFYPRCSPPSLGLPDAAKFRITHVLSGTRGDAQRGGVFSRHPRQSLLRGWVILSLERVEDTL